MCDAIQYIIDNCQNNQTYYDCYKSLQNVDENTVSLLRSLVLTFFQATPEIGTLMIKETSNAYKKVFNMIIITYITVSKPKIAPSKIDPNNTGEVELSTRYGQGTATPAGGRKLRKSKKSRRSKKNRRSRRRTRKY